MDWAYAAIMSLAIFAGWLLSRRTQRGLDVSRTERLAIAVGAFCGAMLGAKLPFALADWPGLLSGAAWFSDGKTIVLGLVGGYFGVEVAKWALGVRVKTGDTFAVPVAVAVGIGRVGCFHAGCCHGTPTELSWGVDFGDGVLRHPTQLYEAAFHLAIAALLAWLAGQALLRGQLVKLYIICYLLYRFVTEWIRPEPQVFGGLTGYQWAAVLLTPLFALLWWRDSRALSRTPSGPIDAPAMRETPSGDEPPGIVAA